MEYNEIKEEAERVGIECVQLLYEDDGSMSAFDKATSLIADIEDGKIRSCLGGMPEGIVVKKDNGKFKMVTNHFKERHAVKQSKVAKTLKEILQLKGSEFNTIPRFRKSIQHLREKEIPTTDTNIVIELDVDLDKEYSDEISCYIKAECYEYISRVFNTTSDISKYSRINDPLILDIITNACELKKSMGLEDNKSNDISALPLFDTLCEKYKPIVYESARSGLNDWLVSDDYKQLS